MRPTLLMLALCVAACGSEPDTTATDMTYSFLINSAEPTSSITINGVRIVIANDLSIETAMVDALKASDGVPKLGEMFGSIADPGFTVTGAALTLRDNHLYLAETDYGPVTPGDDILIDQAGVTVNGELRGPLP